jgi:hypothetical protein
MTDTASPSKWRRTNQWSRFRRFEFLGEGEAIRINPLRMVLDELEGGVWSIWAFGFDAVTFRVDAEAPIEAIQEQALRELRRHTEALFAGLAETLNQAGGVS